MRAGVAVLGDHRRLALGGVRRRVRGLGAGGAGGDGAAAHADRAARLPDERDGRHPLRPAGAAAADRADGRQRGSGRVWCARVRRWPTPTSTRCSARHAERIRGRLRSPARAPRVRRSARARRSARCSRTAGYAGFSFHFDSIGGDGRFEQLPLLAASDLMADGYGYAAEGDTNTASLMCAAQTMIGDAHFSEMYAMDWELDSVLISHMGEGNWRIARRDRPVRLIDRALGIGRLDNPPTPVFSAEPGAGHDRRAGADRGRVLPARRRSRGGARHARAAQGRDALLPLPSGRRDGGVHGRVAAARGRLTTS